MPRTRLPISQGFYKDESLTVSARECVNLFPHIPEGQAITDGALYGTAGISQIANTATNAFNRGCALLNGVPYFICGNKLWQITYTTDSYGNRTYSATDVSGSETIDGTARVVCAVNLTQIAIVAPDVNNQFNCWIYSVAGGLVQISDANFDGPVGGVTFFDSYFLFFKLNSQKWFKSSPLDGLTYNALDYGSAEADPNNITAIHSLNGIVWVFGSRIMEPYQSIDTAGFPFERISSGIQQKGCTAPHSIVEVNGALMWIGAGENEQPSIYISSGGLPQKISPASVDNLIYQGGIIPLKQAFAIRWAERGHIFVSFTVPGICTIVFDAITREWHQKQSLDRFKQSQPWRVKSLVDAYSVRLVGDELTGIIGAMDENTFYEYGDEIRRYFTIPSIENEGRPFSLLQVQLLADTGTNPVIGQGSMPVVRMSISKDGGYIYSPEISRNMGATGDYYSPISWPMLGRYSRSATIRFDISEPIKVVFVKVEVEIGA